MSRRYNPKTNEDLVESGLTLELIRQRWKSAEVQVEEAKSNRATCRICGKRLRKGEKVIASDDVSLRSLYNAFWSERLYAHLECYEKLIAGEFERENNGENLREKSPFNRAYLCDNCGWIPKALALGGRCPFCGHLVRTIPRRKQFLDLTRIEPKFQVKSIRRVVCGQLTLDDFDGRIVWVRRGDRIELYRVE